MSEKKMTFNEAMELALEEANYGSKYYVWRDVNRDLGWYACTCKPIPWPGWRDDDESDLTEDEWSELFSEWMRYSRTIWTRVGS